MTSYRERREAKAARLTEWADKRAQKAAAGFARGDAYRGDHAFNTQPGHIPERARVIAAEERAFQDMNKAAEMNSRAAGIEAQLERSIYSDDPDAIERLEARIATLEAQRDAMKARNAEFRKTHKAELKALTSAYQRDLAMPHQGFELTNLSADIRRNSKRLEELHKAASGTTASRIIYARRNGSCERCGQSIEQGSVIGKFVDGWSHVTVNDDRSQTRCAPIA